MTQSSSTNGRGGEMERQTVAGVATTAKARDPWQKPLETFFALSALKSLIVMCARQGFRWRVPKIVEFVANVLCDLVW